MRGRDVQQRVFRVLSSVFGVVGVLIDGVI